MRVEKLDDPTFRPIVLKVVIDSEEELNALRVMSHLDTSIPQLVSDNDSNIKPSVIDHILDSIAGAI